jgi:hypothetical protein
VSMPAAYPLQLELHADRRITRWRPLVQWLLAIPHLMIAYALRSVRQVLTLNLDKLAGLIETGMVTPSIDRAYPLDQVPDAIRHLEAGQTRGKVAVTAGTALLPRSASGSTWPEGTSA